MKQHIRLFITFLSLALLLCIHTASMAQPPPPPQHGSFSSQAPAGETGGAPIGDGLYLLFALAGLYGGKKVYDTRKALQPENE